MKKIIYPSEIELQQGAKSAVYTTACGGTQAMSNDAATQFPMGSIRIATRKSMLATKQAEMTKRLFVENNLDCEFAFTETAGDKTAHPLFSGKGIFIRELQAKILNDEADIAVHSLKDLPVLNAEYLALKALLPRAAIEDVLIISPIVMQESGLSQLSLEEFRNLSFAELKIYLKKSEFFRQERIGTSSLKRAALVKKYFRREYNLFALRGNVDSRLKKVRNNEFSCILLARAGLERLGLFTHQTSDIFVLDPKIFVPSAGQGIIAIETRDGTEQDPKDLVIEKTCQKITSVESCVQAGVERLVLFLLKADCYTPIGVSLNEQTVFVIIEKYSAFLTCQIHMSQENLHFVHELLKNHQYLYTEFFTALCHSPLAQYFKNTLFKCKIF